MREAVAGRSLAFNSGLDRVERAVVPLVFRRDTLRDRLATFITLARIEVDALLARVQVESALRARAAAVGHCQDDAALGATGDRARSRHFQSTRPERLFAWTRLGLILCVFIAITVHITVLAILLI